MTTNNLYDPTVLPDYGGDLFRHVHAKLHQLDFRNIDDNLITPDDWYSELRQGTLVMVRASLHAFNWDSRRVSIATMSFSYLRIRQKVYQLNAHTVRVLRPSDSDVEEHRQTVLDPDAAFKKRGNSETAALVSAVQLGKRRARE